MLYYSILNHIFFRKIMLDKIGLILLLNYTVNAFYVYVCSHYYYYYYFITLEKTNSCLYVIMSM